MTADAGQPKRPEMYASVDSWSGLVNIFLVGLNSTRWPGSPVA